MQVARINPLITYNGQTQKTKRKTPYIEKEYKKKDETSEKLSKSSKLILGAILLSAAAALGIIIHNKGLGGAKKALQQNTGRPSDPGDYLANGTDIVIGLL